MINKKIKGPIGYDRGRVIQEGEWQQG